MHIDLFTVKILLLFTICIFRVSGESRGDIIIPPKSKLQQQKYDDINNTILFTLNTSFPNIYTL